MPVKSEDCLRSNNPVPKPTREPQGAAGPQSLSYLCACAWYHAGRALSSPQGHIVITISSRVTGKRKPRCRRRRYSHHDLHTLEDWVVEEGPLTLRLVPSCPVLRAGPGLCSHVCEISPGTVSHSSENSQSLPALPASLTCLSNPLF